MKTKQMMALAVILSLCLASFIFPISAASTPEIVRDGLVAWYDGANNSNGEQNYETTVWKDLTGNGNHLQVRVNETNYWKDHAFHIDSASYYFPDEITDVINGEAYTLEFVAGELNFTATDWITLICSDNDELSVFIRVGEENNFEYKYNDDNADRPKIDDGAMTINNATVAITFDLSDPEAGECIVYVDGVAMGRGVPTVKNIADSVTFGHENPQRAWSGDVYGFRFYNRALTPEEIMKNSDADYKKYREGNHYPPEQQYDGSGEDIVPGLTGDFTSDRIPLLEALDLIPYEGFYGTESVIDNVYAYDGEWPGARLIAAETPDTTEDGAAKTPSFHVNYEKFCRKTGQTPLKGEDTPFVVLKVKVEGGYMGDITMYPMSGDNHWHLHVPSVASFFGGAECNGETEYLIYDLTGVWNGQINMFKFVLNDMDPDVKVYVDEIALCASEDAALTYAEELKEGTEAPDDLVTEAPTEPPVEVPAETPVDSETAASTGTGKATEDSDDPDGDSNGCSSTVGVNATAVVLSAIAAAITLKKKN